jgi:hypothetical protein
MSDEMGKLILIGVVLLLAVMGWRAWQIRQASPDWPHVMGTMESARAVARNETGDGSGTPMHMWHSEVRYRYSVGGQTYTGTRLRAFGRNHSSEAEALQELAPFITPGQAVKVYYDPAKPSVSVLIPG